MKKIFLHEPDACIFDIMTLILSDQDYEVKALPDKQNTDLNLELIQYDPDLVIIDCFLDLIKPARWCEKIKSLSPGIFIIATSCNSDIGITYRKMGFDSYLQKPFDINFLTLLVAQYTRQLSHCRSFKKEFIRNL